MNNNSIIIWGGDNFNTLGLLRQLHSDDHDIFFLMLGEPTRCASSSIWFREYKITHSINEGFEFLKSHFINEDLKPVLFTPSDEIIEFVDQHKEELEEYYVIPGTRVQGLLTSIDDKNTMTELARKLGFLVPSSQRLSRGMDINDVTYPVIVKPAHTIPGYKNEFKFKICHSQQSLRKTLKYVREESEFILQQYIPKKSVALVYGARMKEGNVEIAGTLIKDRFIANGDGSHGYLQADLPIGVERDKIEAFLEEINYYGLFSFEYGLCNDKAYFFEVNLRNDGTSHYFHQAGANIPLAWYFNSIGLSYDEICTEITNEAWYIDEIFDITNVWSRNISRKQWISDMKQATIYKYYHKEDMLPWKRMKRGKVRKILFDEIVAKFRIYIVWIINKFKG